MPVRCDAEKYKPSGFHPTIEASSSNATGECGGRAAGSLEPWAITAFEDM